MERARFDRALYQEEEIARIDEDGKVKYFHVCRKFETDNKRIMAAYKALLAGEKEEKKMYTMKDFIEKKIAVQTGTGEKQRKFLELCEKAGFMWNNTTRATGFRPGFYGEKCCITYGFHYDKKLEYCKTDFYKGAGWQIVEYKDIAETANSERYEIKIFIDGDFTTAEMIVDGETVKTATAKRNPADKFNFKTGAELAFTRLFAKKTKEKDSESKRPLRVGDRVVCKAPTDGKLEIVGMHGRVITNRKHPTCIGVEFDKFINGHDCCNAGKLGYCWNCEKETLAREKRRSGKDTRTHDQEKCAYFSAGKCLGTKENDPCKREGCEKWKGEETR